jgi:TRAP-type C4-dicarboxylate transport system permease small subunit
MGKKNFMPTVVRRFYSLTEALLPISYLMLTAIILIICANVCLRYFFNTPFLGAYELATLSMIIFGGFAMLYTTVKGGHVAVDILTNKASGHLKIILTALTSLVALGTWAVMAYGAFERILWLLFPRIQTTNVLNIPTAPFSVILAFAITLCFITTLFQALYPKQTPKSWAEEME